MKHAVIAADKTRRRCDPTSLGFTTTSELDALPELVGQGRASEAIRLALALDRPGYNLFVMGPPGAGRHALVQGILEVEARGRSTPDDWAYVNNFKKPDEPVALRLPAGRGRQLATDMEKLTGDLRAAIVAAFESDEYTAHLESLQTEFKKRHEALFEEIQEQGRTQGVVVLRAPAGFMFAPLKDGKVVPPDEFEKLPDAEKEKLAATVEKLEQSLKEQMKRTPQLQRQLRDRIKSLDRFVTQLTVEHAMAEITERYADLPLVLEYLAQVKVDVVDHAQEFRSDRDEASRVPELFGQSVVERYAVNLVVDNATVKGAPIVLLDHATYSHLVGRIEHRVEVGNLVTNYRLIKAGALLQANGGYLLVDARRLLTLPYAWDGLKQSLRARRVAIESLSHVLGASSSVSLKPEPIPLDVKVVLFGDRRTFYLLNELDPEFHDLFKIEADFEDTIERTADNERLMARMLATMATAHELRPLDSAAVARIIDESARQTGDAQRLSTHARSLVDLLQEADYFAGAHGNPVTSVGDVEEALAIKVRQRDRLRDRLYDSYARGTVLIDVTGQRVGQVNGLAALTLGDFTFGRPTRITATARVGEGKIVDIEREVELGGPLHSKGILILTNYLASRYAPSFPLSLSASLVFEQSYSGVEGDSASLGELCALLSALAVLPVKQSIAVTGSVNQRGQVQAIGAVNEKIEGFVDVCKRLGDSGKKSIIIPAANADHLMLRGDVAKSVASGTISIHAVATVDEAMEILTEADAGEADEDGQMPEGTINGRVQQRLMEYAVLARRFADLVHVDESDGSKA